MSEILSSCWWCCCWRLGGCCRSVMGVAGCPHLRCWRCSSSSALGCSASGRGCGEQRTESAPTRPVETMRTAHRISTNTPCGNRISTNTPCGNRISTNTPCGNRISTNTPCGNSIENQHQHTLWKQWEQFTESQHTLWKQLTESALTHPVETQSAPTHPVETMWLFQLAGEKTF